MYEFLGSLMLFGILALFYNTRHRYFFYAVAIVALINTYYLAFLLGLILCDAYHNRREYFQLLERYHGGLLIILVGLFFGSYMAYPQLGFAYGAMSFGFLENPLHFYNIVGASLIMLGLLSFGWLKMALSVKPLTILGEISFSMYLVHLIIIYSLSIFLFTVLIGYTTYTTAFTLTTIVTYPAIFAGSYLMHKYVDLNGIEISHQIYTGLYNKAAARPVVVIQARK